MYPGGYLTLTLTAIPGGVFQDQEAPPRGFAWRAPDTRRGIEESVVPHLPDSARDTYDRTIRLAVTDFDAATATATATATVRQALEADRSLGLLLPCNVVVGRDGDHTLVQTLGPGTMVTLTGLDALKPVADEATAVSGCLDTYESDWVASALAARGLPVLALDYRKALHGVRYPVPRDDVLAGWHWAVKQPERLPGLRWRSRRPSSPVRARSVVHHLGQPGRGRFRRHCPRTHHPRHRPQLRRPAGAGCVQVYLEPADGSEPPRLVGFSTVEAGPIEAVIAAVTVPARALAT